VVVVCEDGDLVGTSFVFTGVRSPEFEKVIESRGGKISGSVSKSTTHLVVKVVGSGSSKEKKAIELGIKVLTLSDLDKILNNR
jgi:DNA ligase (NAD+)